MPVPPELMPVGSIMCVVDSGRVLEVLSIKGDGSRIFKQLPRDTEFNKDDAFYCFESMLRPEGS